MQNEAIFEVKTVVRLKDVSDAELNNSEVLHPDVLLELNNMLTRRGPLKVFQITLDEVLEIEEKEVNEND